ncbi:hypothetical protein [Dehalogenimonas etheniformans]|nr:hypothetical protein [Dehalogenimonas etheniformans]QNT75536.1 hypothetical protein HX448_01965 [Dehalogenimonas etheniformans]
MKRIHKILISTTVGILILALVWPVMDYGIYFTGPIETLMGVVTVLLGVGGALLLSYAAHEIHPALVPILWAALFLVTLARFLAGNSEGLMEDLAWIFFLGIPGIVLLIVGLRVLVKARGSADKTNR